ncbi:tyrosine-type recombinase/integrase [Paenibacillus taiwanensis]|uniref:tyrosine-type recombinase/integrase n=1 Tax=Paenibacillus taiwanensis TaxID=401638 RepID=UPI000422B859|nr:tyrosine-type recombinase/integrase [Paenibacillus taiwanensis]
MSNVTIYQAVDKFLRNKRTKNLDKKTVDYYKQTLGAFVKFLEEIDVTLPGDIITEDIQEFIELRKKKGNKAPTINKYLRAIEAFLRYLQLKEAIGDNPVTEFGRLQETKRIIRTLDEKMIMEIFGVINQESFVGERNFLFILLLLDTGVRLNEALEIKLTDILWNQRNIFISGKYNKERVVPFSDTLARYLDNYLERRGTLEHDYVFVNIEGDQLKRRTIQDSVLDYANAASIKGVRISPHTFRHTFAKMYLIRGGNVFSLQKILGHSSIEMVRVYVEMFSNEIAEQHNKYTPLNNFQL